MDDISNQFLSLDDAARVLQCTENQVIELLRNGTLPGMKPGRSWVIPHQAFVTAVNAWAHRAAEAQQALVAHEAREDFKKKLGLDQAGAEIQPSTPSRGRGRSRTVMPSMESFG